VSVEVELGPRALKLLVDGFARWLEDSAGRVLELKRELVELLGPQRMVGGSRICVAVAYDSGTTVPRLEFVARTVVLAFVVEVLSLRGVPGQRSVAAALATQGGYEQLESGGELSLAARVLEVASAWRRLESSRDVELVLLDGPLVQGQYLLGRGEKDPLDARKLATPSQAADELRKLLGRGEVSRGVLLRLYASTLLGLAEVARERGVPIVGVVRRVGSTFIRAIAAEQGIRVPNLSDKAIAMLVSSPGHYVDLGRLRPLLIRYWRCEAGNEEEARRKARRIEDIVGRIEKRCEEGAALCSILDETEVLIAWPSRALEPARIEVYPASATEEVLRYIEDTATLSGVPATLELADLLAKRIATAARGVLPTLLAHGTKARTLLLPTNLQL